MPRDWEQGRRTGLETGDLMTQDAAFDVVGIGNAIVDVLSHTTDAFLESGSHQAAMSVCQMC